MALRIRRDNRGFIDSTLQLALGIFNLFCGIDLCALPISLDTIGYPKMDWQASEGEAKRIRYQEQIEKMKKLAYNHPAVTEEVQSIKSRLNV